MNEWEDELYTQSRDIRAGMGGERGLCENHRCRSRGASVLSGEDAWCFGPSWDQGPLLPGCSISWCHCLQRGWTRGPQLVCNPSHPPISWGLLLGNPDPLAAWSSTWERHTHTQAVCVCVFMSWKVAYPPGRISDLCLALPDEHCGWEGPVTTVLLVLMSTLRGSWSSKLSLQVDACLSFPETLELPSLVWREKSRVSHTRNQPWLRHQPGRNISKMREDR